MKLLELNPKFLKIIKPDTWQEIDVLSDADGIEFLCPKCFEKNGMSNVGTHSVVCWRPKVPQTISPVPGRWELVGTGYNDLTLKAGSSSVALMSGCMAHFFITNGEIIQV